MHNIDPNKIDNIKESLENLPENICKTEINTISKLIAELFNDAACKTFPSNTSPFTKKFGSKKWYGPQVNKARRRYHTARKKYHVHKNDQYKYELNRASKVYKQTMHTYIKQHKTRNEQKLRDMHSNRPKDFWKILNNLGTNTTSDKIPDIQAFYEHYKNINTDEDMDANCETPNIEINENINDDLLNREISREEISKMIDKSNNGKAASPQDYIYNEYIKNTKECMLPIYCQFFNKVFDSGILPETWLIGNIKPLYKKKGSPLDPKNYRPITILSCLGKLFTAILNARVTMYLKINNILHENQAGFRANYSTTDHIFTLKFLIDKLRAQKKKIFCSFIDFSTAFDKIWRSGLWNKLTNTGINGKLFRVIYNMYLDIKSCVTVNNNISPFFKSYCGVRQGENLSPILFSIYLNDLQSKLEINNDGLVIEQPNINMDLYLKLFVLLYADDTVIVSDNERSFQNLLNDFDTYCNEWKLSVNMSKTKVIVFGTNRLTNYSFNLNGKRIETVKEYKYLGILFSASGSFLNARKHIVSQAKKAMHILYTRIYNLDLPVDIQLKLFDQTILPILTYNCEVWGFENLEIIERVHTDFLRKLTKSKRSTPLYMLYGELGRYPIELTIKTRMIKFWGKLLSGSGSKISRICYENMFNYMRNNKWLNRIKGILDATGNTYIWENQHAINLKHVHKMVKRSLLDQFLQNWSAQLDISSKGTNYRIFKVDIKLEPYLTILPENKRLVLFHFRTGNHRMPIETGRWRDRHVPYAERKCTLCNMNELGDEFHYLLACPFFRQSRINCMPAKYYRHPNIIKFTQLLTTESIDLLNKITYFVGEIINHFKHT